MRRKLWLLAGLVLAMASSASMAGGGGCLAGAYQYYNDDGQLVGEQTAGSASEQRLVKLPQQRGLWLTWAQYLTRAGEPIHGTGLTPDVVVDEPSVEFDEVPPATDALLDKAIERALAQNAA